MYFFVHKCRRGRNEIENHGKKPQVHLIIMREYSPPVSPILINLDKLTPGAFYSTASTFRYERVGISTFQLINFDLFSMNRKQAILIKEFIKRWFIVRIYSAQFTQDIIFFWWMLHRIWYLLFLFPI